MFESVGEFTVNGKTLMVTDPCYAKEECTNLVEAESGEYELYIDYECRRVKAICVAQGRNYFNDVSDALSYMDGKLPFIVCVDSGQCIIADYNKFIGSEDEYRIICDITNSDESGGIIGDYGGVSCTGWGDGEYNAYVKYNKAGKAKAILVVFMEDEEDEDEDDY